MPLNAIDFSRRAELAELMDGPCSRDQLRACLRDLARLNRWFLGYRPVLSWLDSLKMARSKITPIHIVDVGCGYGDGLRRIERWASERGISVELTGLDLNPDAVAVAQEATPAQSCIQWIGTNVFSYGAKNKIDIVVSSLFTHHLSYEEIVHFVRWMEERAGIGWFINDLSRNAIPYHLIKAFSKVARLHPFVQHDAPVSFARSLVADDWSRMCAAAGLSNNQVFIKGFTPARLCVGRRKPQ
jgi:SAM-dependent methyltransferase